MSRVIQVLLDRVMNGQGEMDWQKLRRAESTPRSHDLLFYFTDPTVNEAMQAAGFAGALRTNDNNFLMVVDSSVGFNKASIAVQQSLAYTVYARSQSRAAGAAHHQMHEYQFPVWVV